MRAGVEAPGAECDQGRLRPVAGGKVAVGNGVPLILGQTGDIGLDILRKNAIVAAAALLQFLFQLRLSFLNATTEQLLLFLAPAAAVVAPIANAAVVVAAVFVAADVIAPVAVIVAAAFAIAADVVSITAASATVVSYLYLFVYFLDLLVVRCEPYVPLQVPDWLRLQLVHCLEGALMSGEEEVSLGQLLVQETGVVAAAPAGKTSKEKGQI